MSDSREDSAASKIQALRRGHVARKEVDEKKKTESAAATKIQAIQRGRHSRKVADQKRVDLTLFQTPPVLRTRDALVINMSLAAVRQRVKAWSELLDALEATECVDSGSRLDTNNIWYSTTDAPESFANVFNEKTFTALTEFDAARVKATKLRKLHDAIEAAKPPPPPPPKVVNEDDEEPAVPQKTKKQLREEEEQRKADRERLRTLLAAEHDAACRQQKLANLLKLGALKVGVVQL